LTPKRKSWREGQTRLWSSPARYGRRTDGNQYIDILMGDQHNDGLNSVVFNLVIPGLWWCARFENLHTEVAKGHSSGRDTVLLGECVPCVHSVAFQRLESIVICFIKLLTARFVLYYIILYVIHVCVCACACQIKFLKVERFKTQVCAAVITAVY
jgi:hypothetical protein